MSYYRTCPSFLAHLDPGGCCDCWNKKPAHGATNTTGGQKEKGLLYAFSSYYDSIEIINLQALFGSESETVRILAQISFNAGISGDTGYLLSADSEILAFTEAAGIPIERAVKNSFLQCLVDLQNHFYFEGRRYAKMKEDDNL